MGEDPPGISVGSYLPKIPSACGGGELNSTKILASAYNKDIQNTWHWSNSVYLTPGKCAARLRRPLPTDGIVLLQYKFPHAQQPALAGCPCGAATIKHTTSFHFISAPTYIESHLSQKHSQNVSPPMYELWLPRSLRKCPQRYPRACLALSRQAFSTSVSPTTDLARHSSGINIPCALFCNPTATRPIISWFVSTLGTLRCQNFCDKSPFTPTPAIKQLALTQINSISVQDRRMHDVLITASFPSLNFPASCLVSLYFFSVQKPY